MRSRWDWEGMVATGRSRPGVPFQPAQMIGVSRRLADVIRQRRVRALRHEDGYLEASVVNLNPETGTCDIWIRWVSRPTVESDP